MEQSVATPPRARRFRWIAGVVLLVLVAPLVWFVATRPLVERGGSAALPGVSTGAAKGVGPLPDHEAPNFRLNDPQGRPVELKQFLGRPVLLNFWATWCEPCRVEQPEMEEFYRLYKDSPGLVVLAVSIDSEATVKHIPEYLKEGDPRVGSYTFPVVVDSKLDVSKLYRITGVPFSYFIDSKGIIRAVRPGFMDREMLIERLRTIMPLPA
ncbi:MAG TPA: TlpA disulfide reductase family protein [Chloroflexota bacterium]|nr:TlpA disulfide reductase family protein [Chloroflexota bacterium]